jgi:hypothetical protein
LVQEVHVKRATITSGTMKARRFAVALGAVTLLAVSSPAAVLADGTFDGGGAVGPEDSYEQYEYGSGPVQVEYDGDTYVYGVGTDGAASYVTYDGEWGDYSTWAEQPESFKWQPAVTTYGDSQYAFAAGESGKYYQSSYDGSEWSGWEDISGEYTYEEAPYSNTYGDYLYVYGVATDGYVYANAYDGAEWGGWEPINEEYSAGWYQPYAVEWGGYNNVFWTGTDGVIYWNRYDGESWSGARDLPYGENTYEYAATPTAVGYGEEDALYAYANAADGTPTYSSFTEDDGWSGWSAYGEPLDGAAVYQPAVCEWEGSLHVVVTGDDGHAYYTAYDGEYTEWADLGDNYAYDPAVYVYDGSLQLNYTGENGYFYYKGYEDGGY